MPRGPKYPDVDGVKRCTACDQTLPVAEFWPVNTPSRYRAECRSCSDKRRRRDYLKARDANLARARERWSSMTGEQRAAYNETQRESRRRRDVADPSRARARERKKLMKRYGITVGDYDRMLAEQGGVCAICSGPPLGKFGLNYHVDHDHETGRVRGLLCGNCNPALGGFKEDPRVLLAAIRYLNR